MDTEKFETSGTPPQVYQAALLDTKCTPAGTIRVCHVVSSEQWAGAEAQVAMLMRHLSKEPRLALSAIVLGEGRLESELRSCGIEILVIPASEAKFFNAFRRASEWIRKRNVQILHSHKSKENLLAMLLAIRFRIPHLLRTQHGMPEPRTMKDRIAYGLEHFTARYVAKIVCVSGELRQKFAQVAPSARLGLVRNAIDLSEVQSNYCVDEAKLRLGIAPEASVVGIVGRLVAVKRVDLFLKVAQSLMQRIPKILFVIAGTGSEEMALRNMVRANGELEQRVLFLGERGDIYDVMRALDLLLITSDHEGLPTVLLEAMALGVPVVARNVGGIGEIIRDEVNGRLIHSADAESFISPCLKLLEPGEQRDRLIDEARQSVQQFSATQNAASYMDLYKRTHIYIPSQ